MVIENCPFRAEFQMLGEALAFSAAFAVQTLLYTPNPDVGPSVRETRELQSSSTNKEVRDAILEAVANATHENITVLAVKAKPVGSAMRYLSLAIVAGALGRI
ncbi:MAG TPA: hypothetical protein VGX69_01995 [Solirubrobacteraceae bacterium]|nr:hypothetical protein [Solirubrobacteraceae bacterium]